MIKRYLFSFVEACAATASASDESSCYTIINADADARTYCLARAHNDPGRCYAIQDSTMRDQCIAEVRK